MQGVANELASQGKAAEDDLILAREASAFYLKLSESVLRQTPDNLKLAAAVSAGFTQYAYAFVSFEAERIETKDIKAAQKLRERASRLYLRAHRHAMDGNFDPHEEEERRFLVRIAARVSETEFDGLVLMAAPRALGVLREALAPGVRAKATQEVAKDVASETAEALRQRLRDLRIP